MPSLPSSVLLAAGTLATALVTAIAVPSGLVPPRPAEIDPAAAVLAPLVVAGIDGLRWEDVSPVLTPALWRLLDDGASAGAVTVQTTGRPACAAGGWLSLSAGRAVAGSISSSRCRPLPPVVQAELGATVLGWAGLAEASVDTVYHPRIGTLGGALAELGVCATAVGPGAALALADPGGRVARYLPTLADETPARSGAMFGCPLTVVDLGSTSVDDTTGERLLVDAALEELLDRVPAGTDLMISSVSSPDGAPLALGVGVVVTQRSPAGVAGGSLLTSPSTRWDGVIRLLDLPSTVTAALRVPEPALFDGSPIVIGGERPGAARVTQDLAALTARDSVLRSVSSWLVTLLSVLGLLLIVAGALVLRCRRPGADGVVPAGQLRTSALQIALLAVACAPVAAYLVALVPWWRSGTPLHALWLSLAAITLALALVVQRLSRRSAAAWFPPALVSGLTVGVLLVDALLGTPMHRLSPLGPSVLTGGRYYGIGNSSFAVLGAHAVLVGGALATWALAHGRRTAAVVVVAAVGMLTLLIDVAPMWGADLGGGPALLPAFVVLAVLVGGARMTWRRILLTAGGGLVLFVLIGWLDWSRPVAQRSHAGRFVQSVLDGDAGATVVRKATFALATVTSGLLPIVTIAIFGTLVLWVGRPERFAPRDVRAAFGAWPTLLPTCGALLVVLGLGALANDYGVRVITIGLTAALPLLAAATLAAVDHHGPAAPARLRPAGSSRPAGAAPVPRDRAAR